MIVAELLAKYGIKLASTAPGRHYTVCPKCSHQRSHAHQSNKVLGVSIEADGRVHFGCSHCGWTGPEKGKGKANGKGKLEPAYIYRDVAGVVRFGKIRNSPGREPRFWLAQPDGRGGWIAGTKGVDTGIIYRADEVAKAIADGRTIACVEGEKDADNLWALGVPATTNAGGASEPGKQPKWKKQHSEQLAGTNLVVLNDNDAAGYAHADATAKLSLGIAARVRRLDLAKHWPGMPPKADVSDWLAAGHDAAELLALIDAAPDFGATTEAPPSADASDPAGNATDDAAELERLARMPPLDYERARKDAGKRLGISRLSLLDALVKAKRSELSLDGDDGKSGHAIEFPTPEPWPQPVNGASLLDEISKAIGAHVIMPEHSCDACVLWIAHTYLLDHMMITPRLGIRSPVKGCGKTTLLDVTGQLVFRPLPAANVSASAIFRVVEGHRPCLLIDEADSFLRDNEELRGVLNSGHRRGGGVLRTVAVGDDFEVRSFSTYGAIAIALIGQLPGTLADRSVPISLTRRKRDEVVTPFRLDRVEHLVALARQLARWAKDNEEAIAATEPEMPTGLYNRAADNWRPLLAIATVAGRDWLVRGHKAALAGAGADVDEGSRLELLLGDIRDIFYALASDRISSAHLIEQLCKIVPRPWGEYGKSGKPLTQNRLAQLLKPLAIAPQVLRIGTETPSGYFRHQFDGAWERFLSPEGEFKPQHLNKPDEIRTSDAFQSSTTEADVEVSKFEKPNNDGLCLGVEVGKGGLGKRAHAGAGNGPAPGLSQHTIHDLARWYIDRAADQQQQNGSVEVDAAELDAGLRQVLAEQVLPEFVEVEFARVMQEVFRV